VTAGPLTDFDPATRTWAVAGVIGSFQEGGDTDDVSYSPYFDSPCTGSTTWRSAPPDRVSR
jgi:hypothetical protein